ENRFLMLKKRGDNFADLLARFPRPVNHLGKTAAPPTVQIERHRLRRAQSLLEISRRNLACHDLASERDQLRRFHAFSLVGRRHARQMPSARSMHDVGSGTAPSSGSPEA